MARDAFVKAADEPYSPLLEMTYADSLELSCPCCAERALVKVQWIAKDGTGYAQGGFQGMCSTCGGFFDHVAFGVRRFAEDAVRWRDDRENTFLA